MLRVILLLIFSIYTCDAQDTAKPSEQKEQTQNTSDPFVDELESFEDEFAPQKSRFDPLEGYNRFMTGFNDYAYTYALAPIARGYRNVVADEIRMSISNFFNNLFFPVRFINNILQGKFKNSGDELLRFLINTTMGIGGLGDPAKIVFDIDAHPEDFGQTLGYWGVGAGFPLVLPILGPSNLRDSISLVPEYYSNPTSYLEDRNLALGLETFKRLNETSFYIDQYFLAKKDAIDFYIYLQNFYESRRQQAIKQ